MQVVYNNGLPESCQEIRHLLRSAVGLHGFVRQDSGPGERWFSPGLGALGDSQPLRVLGKAPDENAAGCAWASVGRGPGECHEESYIYRSLIAGGAELGLRRGIFGEQLAIIGRIRRIRRKSVGHLGGGYAGGDVDWLGKHAAICGDGPSFRQHYERCEQFRYVEFVGCERGVDQRGRVGQRRCGWHGNDWGGFGNDSRIGDAFGDCGGGQSAVDYDFAGGLVDAGQYQPAVYGDWRIQRRQQF